MTRLRVLFAAHSPNRGGAEYCLDTTLRHLNRDEFEPIIVFPFDGPLVKSTRQMGIETLIMPMCHWLYFKKNAWYWRNLLGRSLKQVNQFANLIRTREIDIAYTNTSAIFELAIAARRTRVPHVWHIHEVLHKGNAMSQLLPIPLLQRFIRRYSDQVIFESNAAKSVFERTTPIPRSAVVYNSLRLCSPDTKITGVQRRNPDSAEPSVIPKIACVGQFMDRKNPLLLVEAVSRLPKSLEVECLFVGAGPLESAMRELIKTLRLTEKCRILPFQRDVTPVLEACDILVLPSRQESFGLVLIEAAFFSKPVIACRSQGPCEIIVDGRTGLIVGQDDPDALAQAIEKLLMAPELAKWMGSEGKLRVKELFSPEANTKKIESLMVKTLKNASI